MVKTSLYIPFNCPYRLIRRSASGSNDIDYIPNCVFLRPIWPEPITVRVELGFTYWLNDDSHAFLDYPVQHCGYAKGALFAVAFGDVDPAGRFGL